MNNRCLYISVLFLNFGMCNAMVRAVPQPALAQQHLLQAVRQLAVEETRFHDHCRGLEAAGAAKAVAFAPMLPARSPLPDRAQSVTPPLRPAAPGPDHPHQALLSGSSSQGNQSLNDYPLFVRIVLPTGMFLGMLIPPKKIESLRKNIKNGANRLYIMMRGQQKPVVITK